jgi:hypothetical protein
MATLTLFKDANIHDLNPDLKPLRDLSNDEWEDKFKG